MADAQVNYDQLAATYDQRYTVNKFEGIAAALRALVQQSSAKRVLEVGCGTGRWLAELQPLVRQIYGVDLSLGMLQQARQRPEPVFLACGHANALPFADATFDLLFCVNAFHHFSDPRSFIVEARRLLRPGGALTIIGIDPHRGYDRWYIYEYFPGTYETDLRRFSSGGTVLDWMITAGFAQADWRVAERIEHTLVGRAVLQDPILQKHGTSQLALLTDEAYTRGREQIETALREAEVEGTTLIFPVDISLTMVTGWVPEQ